MRWIDLFNDLEGQLAAAHSAEFEASVTELTTAERASIALAARIVASLESEVALVLEGGEIVNGAVVDATVQWVLVSDGPRQHLIPVAAIASARGVSARAAQVGPVASGLTLGHALRALARNRTRVTILTAGGELSGSVVSVGADHLDLETEGALSVAVAFHQVRRVTSV